MDWMRFRKIYFAISGVIIAIGIFGLITWGLKLGVDFRGGTIAEYKFEKSISTEEITKVLENADIDISGIQEISDNQYLIRTPPLNSDERNIFRTSLEKIEGAGSEELRFE